jgi:hypothetical protein
LRDPSHYESNVAYGRYSVAAGSYAGSPSRGQHHGHGIAVGQWMGLAGESSQRLGDLAHRGFRVDPDRSQSPARVRAVEGKKAISSP